MRTTIQTFDIDLSSATEIVIPCAEFNYASFQVEPLNYASTTADIAIKESLTGQAVDAQAFGTPVAPNMTTRAIELDEDIKGVAYLHAVITADAGKRCRLHVYMSDREQ